MMYRRGIWLRILLALVLVVVLVGGGMAVYRAGWVQGYQAGTLLSGNEGGEFVPLVPQFRGQLYHPFMPGFGFPFYGLCLSIGFIFLIMFLIGGIFGPWGRRRWVGHHHYGKWGYGPVPPWVKDWEEHQRKHAQEEGDSEENSADPPDEI
jgi:hypothetical protein